MYIYLLVVYIASSEHEPSTYRQRIYEDARMLCENVESLEQIDANLQIYRIQIPVGLPKFVKPNIEKVRCPPLKPIPELVLEVVK